MLVYFDGRLHEVTALTDSSPFLTINNYAMVLFLEYCNDFSGVKIKNGEFPFLMRVVYYVNLCLMLNYSKEKLKMT